MALFTNDLPPELVYKSPSYATKRKGLLAFLGYKADGTQNTWGKIMSWIPGAGSIASNKLAEEVARKSGASDTADNISDDLDNRVNKQLGILKIAAGVARGMSGDIAGGIQTGVSGISNITATAASPVDRSENSMERTTGYMRYADGGTPTKKKKPASSAATGGTRAMADYQRLLNEKMGAGLTVDGMWGPKTKEAHDRYELGLKLMRDTKAGGLLDEDPGAPALKPSFTLPNYESAPTQENPANILRNLFLIDGVTGNVNAIPMPQPSRVPTVEGRDLTIDDFMALPDRPKRSSTITNPFPTGVRGSDLPIFNPLPSKDPKLQFADMPPHEDNRIMYRRDASGNTVTGSSPWTPTSSRRKKVVGESHWTPVPTFFKGGTVPGSDKMYDKDDTTEDIYMVDKTLAKKLGLTKIMESIRMGEMRYNETIFDQEATKEIDRLIEKGDVVGLGEYVKSERGTHQVFAGGGTPVQGVKPGRGRPKKSAPKQIVAPGIKQNLRTLTDDVFEIMNPFVQQRTGFPDLSNLMDEHVQTATKDGPNPAGPRPELTMKDLEAMYGNLLKDPVATTTEGGSVTDPPSKQPTVLDNILNRYKDLSTLVPVGGAGDSILDGVTVTAKRTKPKPYPVKPTITQLSKTDYSKLMADHAATVAQQAQENPAVAATAAASPGGRTDLMDNILGGLDSLAKVGIGSMMAGKGLPSWTVSSDWIDYRNRAKLLSESGYTPEEVAFGNRQISDAAKINAQNVVNQLGGGGSTGAVIAGLGSVHRASADAAAGLAAQNAQQQRQNFGIYGNLLAQDTAYDLQKFGIDYQNAASVMNAGLGLINSGLQGAQDQLSYNRAYGPNSMYSKLLGAYTRQIEKNSASLNRDTITSLLK